MKKIPQVIEHHLTFGRKLFESGAALEPLFSRGTYQVEVKDQDLSYFPFLQMQDDGQLSDSFCTCKVSEAGLGCPHLSVAYLRIFNETPQPLHVRFQNSLWNRLFEMCSKKVGYQSRVFKEEEGQIVCRSKTKKKLFSNVFKTPEARQKFQEITAEKPEETEETSLKFSNLSSEEISDWKKGKAKDELCYELSFWSDLAKWIMGLSEEKSLCAIEFKEVPSQLPSEMTASFENLELWFYLPDASWPTIIPTLSRVHSPLQVFDLESSGLQNAFYDEERRTLFLTQSAASQKEKGPAGQLVGKEWVYVPHKGFYRKNPERLFSKGELQSSQIAAVLSVAHETLKQFLTIHPQPTPAQYHLEFDADGNLHIQLYVFSSKDLQHPLSECFFPWVYLAEQRAFYLLESWMFEGKEKVIAKPDVAEFINQHRLWLINFPGFQTHLGSLEARLTYEVTPEKQLIFSAKLDYPDQFGEMIDLGPWVYLKGQGFYMKKENRSRFFLHPGLTIESFGIAQFIEAHKEDLEQVENFYSSLSPLVKLGLTISLTDDELIAVTPDWEYAAGTNSQDILLFGHFIYQKGRGFFEIPPSMRLPERYQEKTILPASQEASFLAYELEPLKPWISKIDPRLNKPSHLRLKIRKILRSKKTKGQQWLVDLIYESDSGWIDIFSIWDGFQEKQRHLFSPAGLLSLKDPRFNWVRQLAKKQLDRNKGMIRLNTLEWIRLSVFEEISLPKDAEAEETKELLSQVESLETTKLLNIEQLNARLRPYQEIGLHWLWFLYCHQLSGLLADDMGLGKTHQAMALLASISHEDPDKTKKYLVVCPTSVIYHWQELLKEFLPSIRVCTYYGIARTLDQFETQFDLLLTSYGILRTGKEDLREHSFELAIFDEIQIAKNQSSQTHAALRQIDAKMRLGLSGTPIENHLRELKALFDIILPGYMPPDAVFREMFIQPIEKYKDEQQKTLLTKLVKPFILRRKKSEVLLDLPEKTETISYCDLSEEQKRLYREVALNMQGTIYRELCDNTKPVPYLHVF
ncbi:MAG: DEAD/DEAH box helicase family protein, partial [Chlamydiae bacterium]|nr:DEAD/DEAH box helicase family protein [Chlamydiota bacterium]